MPTVQPFDAIGDFCQVGLQSGFGTSVAATQRIPFTTLTFTPGYRYSTPNLRSGTRERNLVVAQNEFECAVRMQVSAFPKWIAMLLQPFWGLPSGQPAVFDTSGYKWSFATSEPAATPLVPATIEFDRGDVWPWYARDVFWSQVAINGAANGELTLDLTGGALFFDQLADMTSLAFASDSELSFWNHTFSMDDGGFAPGTTELDGYLKGMAFSMTNGATPHHNRNNSRFAGYVARGFLEGAMTLTGLDDALTRLAWDEFNTGQDQVWQLKYLSPNILVTEYTGLNVNFAGKLMRREDYDDANAAGLRMVLLPKKDDVLGYSVQVENINTMSDY